MTEFFITDFDIDELNALELKKYTSDTESIEKRIVLKYLKSFDVSAYTSQPVYDIITGEEVFCADNAHSDGVYTWYESEIYHYETYNLILSKEFIDYVLAKFQIAPK